MSSVTRRLVLAGICTILSSFSGCQLATTPASQILPVAAIETSDQTTTLRSAQIRYETIDLSADSGDATNRRLLAIRYPHPNGRLDVARAEIVVADAAGDDEAPSGKSNNRWTQFLVDLSPGVSWSSGIKQAKAHDVKLAELNELLADSSAWSNDQAARAAASSALGEEKGKDKTAAVSDGPATLLVEVNGVTTELANVRPSRLDAIAAQVLARGKLISVNQQPAELFQLSDFGESGTLANTATASQLVPFPVVHKGEPE